MDLADLDLVASTGAVLSLTHKSAMQSSLPLLKKNYKFAAVKFWGKLTGRLGDYLIAVGIQSSYTSGKLFFFCQDGVSWAQLPRLGASERAACAALLPAALEGDIAHVHGRVVEENLLTHIIESIEEEAAIVPAGSLMLSSAGIATLNPAYTGPAAAWVRLGMAKAADPLKPAVVARTDFLESSDTIEPKGALVSVTDAPTGAATVRSLIYPGFVAFSKGDRWGCCYCGSGAKNADVAFMLP
jgi:radial spoke head protein 9